MKLEQFLSSGLIITGTLISAIILYFGMWSRKAANKAEENIEILDLIPQREGLQQEYDNIRENNARVGELVGYVREDRNNEITNIEEQQENANELLRILRERERVGYVPPAGRRIWF